MNEKNQLFQKFIQNLTELIMDKYDASYDIIKMQGIKLGITLNGILIWQGAYREAEKQKKTGFINQKDFDEKSIAYIASMNRCLQQLDLDELEDDTLENFRLEKENENQKFAEAGDETPSFEDLDELDDPRFNKKKIILEKIDITNIEIPESSDILDIPEKRYEFRKRMTNIQDYLTLGSYDKALEECEYILKNLELQSSQLHEYHTISYYKVKGGEYGIIQDIQEQKEATLKQLILCITRCRLYNKKRIDRFENNIEFMCYRMSIFLREKY